MQALWTGYEQTMRQLGFDQTAPLYVASGLLTYMDFKGATRTTSCCLPGAEVFLFWA